MKAPSGFNVIAFQPVPRQEVPLPPKYSIQPRLLTTVPIRVINHPALNYWLQSQALPGQEWNPESVTL